jgi:hypothetical protein
MRLRSFVLLPCMLHPDTHPGWQQRIGGDAKACPITWLAGSGHVSVCVPLPASRTRVINRTTVLGDPNCVSLGCLTHGAFVAPRLHVDGLCHGVARCRQRSRDVGSCKPNQIKYSNAAPAVTPLDSPPPATWKCTRVHTTFRCALARCIMYRYGY